MAARRLEFPARPKGMDDETWDLVERAAAAGVLAEAPTAPRPTLEELEAAAGIFTDLIGGQDGAQAILAALDAGRA